MSYPALVNRLFNLSLFGGVKLGLENMERLQQLLDYPDRTFASIHVAGTNGKGSVCIKIAHAFMQAGYRVGLYTSPHISSFRERIKINGKMVSEYDVEAILNHIFDLIERDKIAATFFEMTTALALLYFAKEKVDVAVIETGLGGRLDATNVILPCLSIITSISLDHTDLLGNSCEQIAQEKGGIIKEKVPVIIGPHVPLEPIQSIAKQKQSFCIQVKEHSNLFEEENQSIARAALNYLKLSSKAIEEGLKARQPCRFEIVKSSPTTILDVAHNPDGIAHLFKSLEHHFPDVPLRLLFGLSKNKDVESCLKLIATHGTHFHIVEASNGRGASLESLRSKLLQYSTTNISIHASISRAVKEASELARSQGELLVIFGTFFIMSQARQALGIQEPYDIIDLNERNFHGISA